MIAPFPLFVDEISPDKIKATVQDPGTIFYNFRMLMLDVSFSAPAGAYTSPNRTTITDRLGQEINGACITPIGKFICMYVKHGPGKGMIFLDLINNPELAEKLAGKLNDVALEERFLQVYEEVLSKTATHGRYKLVARNNWQAER